MSSSLTKGTVRVQVRKDTASNWTLADPTLASGELGFETDTNLLKIGSGSTPWTNLGYLGQIQIRDTDGDQIFVDHTDYWVISEGTGINVNHTDTSSPTFTTEISCDLRGEELSSALTAGGNATDGHVLTATGSGTAAWEAAAGGGATTWQITRAAYKTNNNSTTSYYFPYYSTQNSWSSNDNSPTSLSYTKDTGYIWHADADGTLTNMKGTVRALDTGLTDPVRFYVFKGTLVNDATTITTVLIGTSDAITPVSGKVTTFSTDISSSNDFDAGQVLYIMYKKDSTSGNQDLYFSITISGEYD